MVDHRLRDLRGPARRDFLRWVGAAAAAVALDRSRLLDFLADSGGSALADEACPAANRSIHVIGGRGSFSWFSLLWPHIDVAKSPDPKMAYHAFGQGFEYGGDPAKGDKPFYYGPEAPWIDANGAPLRPVTGLLAGKDETHSSVPGSAATLGGGRSMLASVASIQSALPTLIPVIGVGPLDFGAAPGAPPVATASSGEAMIDLFNSVSSNLTLKAQEDKALFETYYRAHLGLRYAAGKPSWAPHIEVTKKSAQLIGVNYGAALTPSPDDLQSYGLMELGVSAATPTQKAKLGAFGRAMIVSARALKLGLTSSVILALHQDDTSDPEFTDPHEAFNDLSALKATVKALGAILNGFYADLALAPDPACAGQTLDQSVIFTAHGDTPKTPLVRSGWPDNTPAGSNWLYVMGNGHLKTGWFGGVRTNGQVDGFDAATGALVPNQSSLVTSAPAGAAVAYAVARGRMSAVTPFYSGSIHGIVRE